MAKTRKYQKSTFAINVVNERKKRGMTGLQFAELAGIPYSTLADIEAGMSAGRESTKQKIAIALGLTVDELNTPATSQVSAQNKSQLISKIVGSLAALNEDQLRSILMITSGMSGSANRASPPGQASNES